jgi:cyanophycin synthetase
MEIRRVAALRGPNVWANSPVLEAWLALSPAENQPSHTFAGFCDRLIAWLPSLHEHRCSVGEPGGFVSRLRDGTYLGHILEHVTLEFETLAGTPIGFGRTRETSESGVYKVVVKYKNEEVARAALATAHALLEAALAGADFDVDGRVRALRDLADRVCLGPSTLAIVMAAEERGIPHVRLNSGSLVQLGYGKAQRRIWTAETDSTSAVAEAIAQDKELTRRLLRECGLPVAEGRAVSSPEDAWDAAREIGTPVVVKPRDGNHGRGVCIGLADRSSVMEAYGLAAEQGSSVVIERLVPGDPYRVLVVNDRVVAATRGEPEQVVGDGVQTIEQLVAELNRNPARSEDEASLLGPVELDGVALQALRTQGFDRSSVPPPGKVIAIHHYGDYTTDATDWVHPTTAAACVVAAQTVGLDLAGIDVVASNIEQPLEGQRGAILEVNASPGLLMHLKPLHGQPRPVGEAIISGLFPDGRSSRIPVIAVTGTNGKSTVVDLLAGVLEHAGTTVGVASSDGLYVARRVLSRDDCANGTAARRLLTNPFVETVVVEVSAQSVLDEGLGFDRCQVAVVTNLGSGDHLGLKYVDTLETMKRVKRAPVDVVLPTGAAVLNADDPNVLALGEHCRGETILFGRSTTNPMLRKHCESGNRAVYVDGEAVVLVAQSSQRAALPLGALGFGTLGRESFELYNVLATAAAAWALGVEEAAILNGLRRFGTSCLSRRVHAFEHQGRRVLLTLCRNASALRALVSALDTCRGLGHRTVVYAARPDWRTEDALEQGRILGTAFDQVILQIPEPQSAETLSGLTFELEAGVRSTTRSTLRRQAVACQNVELTLGQLTRSELIVLQMQTNAQLQAVAAQLENVGAHSVVLSEAPTKARESALPANQHDQPPIRP